MAGAGDKTEAPTPRRLEQARRRGEIAFSRDLSGAAVFVGILATLVLGATSGIAGTVTYMKTAFIAAFHGQTATVALHAGLDAARRTALPVLLAAAAVALGVGLVQTKGLISTQALRLDPARVMPKWGRVISGGAIVEMAKGLLKVVVAGFVVWLTLRPLVRDLGNLAGAPPGGILRALGTFVAQLGWRLALMMVALGAGDLLWQRWRYLRNQRMTREEVKREYKESEGDPHHKAERGRLHRELSEQRMVADVRKADFVVVNPDHIAVALRYDRESDAAPLVVAKGERLLAEKIKEVAREAGVPIFRDVNLARSLREVQEGDEIPEALYEAVAEIMRVIGNVPPPPPVVAEDTDSAPQVDRSFWKRA